MKEKFFKKFWLSRAKEVFGLFLIFFTFYTCLSLLTYHPLDPTFNSSVDNIITNRGGRLGSIISSFLLEFFGLASFVMLLFMGSFGVFFVKKSIPNYLVLRFISFLLSLTFLCFFLSYFKTSYSWEFISYGGILGFYLKFLLNGYSSLALLSFVSFILFLGFFCFAHTISFGSAVSAFKKLSIYLMKKIALYASRTPSYARRSYIYIRLVLEKRFFKKRIKDIDSSYDKPKEKIAKIDKGAIPEVKKLREYQLPDVSILGIEKSKKKNNISKDKLSESAERLQTTLDDFGIDGKIIEVKPGPVVTLYEFKPSPGIKSSRVIGLADDVARSMSAVSARISVISGQNAMGIELPNESREIVYLRELFTSSEYKDKDINLPLALGKNIAGEPVTADLSKMPHLLVAGTTGSGKSVAINTMIISILFKLSPAECKFIMIDPKMLELSVYDGIPHLLSPVVTDAKKAVQSLRWVVQEMENRYRLMSSLGVRNIAGYNETIKKAVKKNKVLTRTVQTGFDEESGKPVFEEVELDMQTLPFIVVIVDEMADLMLVAGKEIESYLQRIAQMARAAGIHLIVATQRPSVDVITGVIKANFPTRVSFQVTSKIDSRTILGEQGAEQLLGMGDMLYMFGASKLTRIHGTFISDDEVKDVVKFLKKQGKPAYIEDIFNEDATGGGGFDAGGSMSDSDRDELYDKAVNIVLKDKKVSISYVQRQLRIGYNRSANIIEQMEAEGVVSAASPTGKREILVNN